MIFNQVLLTKQPPKSKIDNSVSPEWKFGDKSKINAEHRGKIYKKYNDPGSRVSEDQM